MNVSLGVIRMPMGNIKIIIVNIGLIVPPNAIIIWNNDAHVLSKTCPAWGNLVVGLK